MSKKNKKILKFALLIPLLLIVGFIAFILFETKDEINADLDNIEEKLYGFYNQNRMAGFAISVFDQDSILYAKGFGYADLKKQAPYTKQTQQYIASISKTTIGIALMKAEELGLLNIDDPINKYLPFEVINPIFPKTNITFKQLATHTSSLDYNEKVVESLYVKELHKEESLESFMVDYFKNGKYGEIKFTKNIPGADWNYSNIGASLAGFIIERVSGITFSAFTQKYIFAPLELNNTFWLESVSDSLLHTKYYEPAKDSIIEVTTSGVKLYPSRDMITNVEDLTIYCKAILSKVPKLLTVDSFDELLSPLIDDSVTNQNVDNCGLFFMIDRNQYGVTYQLTGMNGGDYCINTMMWFDQKTNLGYIFIGNTGSSELNKINHILIYRTLASLGDNILMEKSSVGDKLKYKWHNLYSRVKGLF